MNRKVDDHHVGKPQKSDHEEDREERESFEGRTREYAFRKRGPASEPPAHAHRDSHEKDRLNDERPDGGDRVVAVARNLVEAVPNQQIRRSVRLREKRRRREPRGRKRGRVQGEPRVRDDARKRRLYGAALHREGAVGKDVDGRVFPAGLMFFEVLRDRYDHVHFLCAKRRDRLARVGRAKPHVKDGRSLHGGSEAAGGGRRVLVDNGDGDELNLLIHVGPGVENEVKGRCARENQEGVAREDRFLYEEGRKAPKARRTRFVGRVRLLFLGLRPKARAEGEKTESGEAGERGETREPGDFLPARKTVGGENPFVRLGLEVVREREKLGEKLRSRRHRFDRVGKAREGEGRGEKADDRRDGDHPAHAEGREEKRKAGRTQDKQVRRKEPLPPGAGNAPAEPTREDGDPEGAPERKENRPGKEFSEKARGDPVFVRGAPGAVAALAPGSHDDAAEGEGRRESDEPRDDRGRDVGAEVEGDVPEKVDVGERDAQAPGVLFDRSARHREALCGGGGLHRGQGRLEVDFEDGAHGVIALVEVDDDGGAPSR